MLQNALVIFAYFPSNYSLALRTKEKLCRNKNFPLNISYFLYRTEKQKSEEQKLECEIHLEIKIHEGKNYHFKNILHFSAQNISKVGGNAASVKMVIKKSVSKPHNKNENSIVQHRKWKILLIFLPCERSHVLIKINFLHLDRIVVAFVNAREPHLMNVL